MNHTVVNRLVEREVLINPWDEHTREGIIKGVDDFGYLIQITLSNDPKFHDGDLFFIPHYEGLIFKLK